MGIKTKKTGPKPNIPSNLERWQVLALSPDRHVEAVELLRKTHPNLKLVDAARRVKAFHTAQQGKYHV